MTDAQREDLAHYLLDHYGECGRGAACYTHGCRKPDGIALGRLCGWWKPLGARTWEELREALARREAKDIDGS